MPVEDKRDPRTHALIGAAMEVHRQLGCGFLEAVYQEAFHHELLERSIPFQREVHISVFYKGSRLAADYRADFVCFGSVVVEVKALQKLTGIEEAQVISYLKATAREVALLLNFGAKSLEFRRFIFSKSLKSA
ncbi:MAG TPA: GxxExxY protein [Terriglobia bacterium]|nr:GxxExxY protein [Terriglobia bacterium]